MLAHLVAHFSEAGFFVKQEYRALAGNALVHLDLLQLSFVLLDDALVLENVNNLVLIQVFQVFFRLALLLSEVQLRSFWLFNLIGLVVAVSHEHFLGLLSPFSFFLAQELLSLGLLDLKFVLFFVFFLKERV